MGKIVLCVDDSPTIRMLVKKSLVPEGFEVLEAGDGKQGIEVCQKNSAIDLFIVDVNMPNIDGFEFVKWLKASETFKEKSIVFLTTESGADKKQIGKKLGVNGWIVKPFEAPALVGIVKLLLKGK